MLDHPAFKIIAGALIVAVLWFAVIAIFKAAPLLSIIVLVALLAYVCFGGVDKYDDDGAA